MRPEFTTPTVHQKASTFSRFWSHRFSKSSPFSHGTKAWRDDALELLNKVNRNNKDPWTMKPITKLPHRPMWSMTRIESTMPAKSPRLKSIRIPWGKPGAPVARRSRYKRGPQVSKRTVVEASITKRDIAKILRALFRVFWCLVSCSVNGALTVLVPQTGGSCN